MNQNFYEAVEDNPIIAAVKSMEDVEECCKHDDIRVIFILFGDVCSIGSIVKTIRDAGKIAMVHMDLISGLSPKEIAVEFIKEQTEADGIISTKPSLIKKAKEMSMYTVLRVFLLDSMAFENIRQQQHMIKPDFIEVLPGVMLQCLSPVYPGCRSVHRSQLQVHNPSFRVRRMIKRYAGFCICNTVLPTSDAVLLLSR